MAQDIQGMLLEAAAHHRAGQLAQAEAGYRAVLRIEPGNPNALHLLGVVAAAAGQSGAAVDLIRQAIAALPTLAEAHYNLGRVLHREGDLRAAEAAYREAIRLRPEYAEAHDNLAGVLQAEGRLDEALASCRRALELRPDFPAALSDLGAVLQDLGRVNEAIAAYEQALRLEPAFPQAAHNLGEALQDAHRGRESIAAYERALAIEPDYAEAHCGLAFALLRAGDLPRGWEEYEWRFRRADSPAPAHPLPGQVWDGSDPAGKTILVQAEQGFGDTIQFARYLPLLAARGARVIFQCQRALARLFDAAITVDDPLPAYDCHVPLLSLPRLFDTTLDTIPASVPYLRAPEAWPAPFGRDGRVRVGLVWHANPHAQLARSWRSLPLDALQLLTDLDATFVSLQTEPVPDGSPVLDVSSRLTDFGATAALVQELDLVISVDTAVAHLAGALGRPVWTLLPYAADWRWLRDRSDSPWYPTMRLFRQPAWGDWSSLIKEVAGELATLLRS
jgi:tetratricopeptide (TPR) repeat protein